MKGDALRFLQHGADHVLSTFWRLAFVGSHSVLRESLLSGIISVLVRTEWTTLGHSRLAGFFRSLSQEIIPFSLDLRLIVQNHAQQ